MEKEANEVPRDFSIVVPSNEPIDWKDAFLKLRAHCDALEHTRSDLWGSNEELRNKIKSLEFGQDDDLAIRNELLRRAVVACRRFVFSGQGQKDACDALDKLEQMRLVFVETPTGKAL